MSDSNHKYVGTLLMVFTILILLAGIFFTVAQTKVNSLQEYKNGNTISYTTNNII